MGRRSALRRRPGVAKAQASARPSQARRPRTTIPVQEDLMFYHVKELQFNARVSGPDPRFASLLLE